MKTYEEMSKSVFESIENYNLEKERKNKIKKRMIIPIFTVFMFTLAVFGLEKVGIIKIKTENGGKVKPETVNENSVGNQTGNSENSNQNKDSETERTTVTNSSNNGKVSTVTAVTSIAGSTENQDTFGGDQVGGNWWSIPTLPFDRSFEVIGEELTDEEAGRYFAENMGGLSSTLSASGVATDNLKIMPNGYCHISYDGVEGKPFAIKQNFRDYLCYSGDKLVAIITLVKEGGKISATPSLGAPWFDDFNERLIKYKGEKLIFVYATCMEFVVTPDNKYFCPQGYELGLDFSDAMFGDKGMYSTFYHEKAVYIP